MKSKFNKGVLMKEKMLITFLCAILLVMVTTVWANPYKEKEVSDQIKTTDSDRAPVMSPYRAPAPAPFALDELIWSVKANMPTARYSGATGTYGGELFVSHGRRSDAVPYNTSVVEAYNLSADTWRTDPTPGPTARRMVAGGAMYEGNFLYVVGGRAEPSTTVGTLEIYDMSTDTWTTGPPCTPRWAHAGAVLGGYVYVFGGTPATTTQRYNIASGTWESLASMPNPAGWLSGAAAAGKVYAIGGSGTETVMREYDPATNTWTLRAPIPHGRLYARSVGVNDLVYVAGGDQAGNSVDVYDPATNTWVAETNMPNIISWQQMGHDAGSVFVIGGSPTSTPVVYQSQNWQGTFGVVGQPAAVSDLEAIAGAAGALSCSLSWVNPTLDALGNPLTELLGIRILRDGTQIADLTPAGIGAAMEYADAAIPEAGQYSYTVYGYNTGGDGLQTGVSLWIGPDVPSNVTNLVMTPGANFELEATLTWVNPTEGAHGGFFPGITGYTIFRDSDEGHSATFDLPGTHTTYFDDSVPDPDYYWYEVTPYNASGDGLTATSNTAYIGIPEIWTWEEVTYVWNDISTIGTNAGLTSDDQNVGPFPLGFDFEFFGGTVFTSIRLCSNGWQSFTSTVTTYSNVAIPSTAEPNNLIASFWDDLNPSTAGTAYYYFDATANTFTIQYDGFAYFGAAGNVTFQVVLDGDDNTITCYYNSNTGVNNSCTVGIENAAGDDGIQVCYNGAGAFIPTNNTAIRFNPPLPPLMGTLEGYVYEEQAPQEPLEGAYVVIRSDTGYTDVTGFYHIENIYIGTTSATARAFGYNSVIESVVIANDSTTTMDYYLTQPIIDVDISSIDLAIPANFPHDEEFNIFNNGNGPLDFDITILGAGTDWGVDETDEPWLSAVPDQGTVAPGDSQTIILSFLMPDTANVGDFYQADLVIDNNTIIPQIIIPVEVTIIINAVTGDEAILPTEFALYQNYPNPFNPTTTISYDVPVQGLVQVEVFDVLGRKVTTLVNGAMDAGRYHIAWNAREMPSGIYFCRMQAESFHQVRKVVLLK